MTKPIRIALHALAFGSALTLGTAAFAEFGGGGGGGSGSSDGDWALRTELQNPRFNEPGSPYGYDRTYSRGPVWQYPPAYQAGPPPERVRRNGQPYR
ncbi:MAG TPA: hypothetical protein VF744_19700 [Beijerinckiaceae bacterium]|jgi:hypothetical protein